jgi:hypothetical protein
MLFSTLFIIMFLAKADKISNDILSLVVFLSSNFRLRTETIFSNFTGFSLPDLHESALVCHF